LSVANHTRRRYGPAPVVEFFERSAYKPEAVDERTIALSPPEDVRIELARREVEIYLRVLARVHHGVGASLAG
jgi:hypothetical protein